MREEPSTDSRAGPAPESGRPAPRAAPGGFRPHEPLLELGRIAGLPFGAHWLLMANGHRWGPFSPRTSGERRRASAAGGRRRHVTMVL